MKHILTSVVAFVALFLTSCTGFQSPDLVAAITPATMVTVSKKPALVAPLFSLVGAIKTAVATGEVTPASLVAAIASVQKKNPEIFAIAQLVVSAYTGGYKVDANNVATLLAIATAIENGLPKGLDIGSDESGNPL